MATKVWPSLWLVALSGFVLPAAAQDPPDEHPSFSVATVAGSAPGPSDLASEAFIATAYGITLDEAGNVLIVDTSSHCVRRVTPDGRISLVAGSGEPGFSGDGGPATEAQMNEPRAVAIGEGGALYISDARNSRIRVVSTEGLISTLKLSAADDFLNDPERLRDPSFIRYDPSSRRLFIAEANMVRFVDEQGVLHRFAGTGERGLALDGGPATEARLAGVRDVAVEPDGSVLISQSFPPTIKRVLPDGTLTTAFDPQSARNESGAALELGSIGGLAFDSAGRLHFTDFVAGHIYRLNPDNSLTAVTPAGLERADRGILYWPWSLIIAPGGDIYFSQFSQGVVRRITPEGSISVVAGGSQLRGDGGPALEARLFHPSDVSLDRLGNLYIADRDNAVIRRVSPDGIIERFAGSGERRSNAASGTAAQEAAIGFVTHLTAAEDIVYFGSGKDVRSVSSTVVDYVGSLLSPTIGLPIGGLQASPDGGLYLSNFSDHRIWRWSLGGGIPTLVAGDGRRGFSGDAGPAVDASLQLPGDLTTDPDGNLYFVDRGNRRVRRISRDGSIVTIAGNGESAPEPADGEPATEVALMDPQGLAWGPDGALYLSDGPTIRRIFLPVDPTAATQERRAAPEAVIVTIAGDGVRGYGGDGGPATQARFDSPRGIEFGPDGRLYVADFGNHRIRVLIPQR